MKKSYHSFVRKNYIVFFLFFAFLISVVISNSFSYASSKKSTNSVKTVKVGSKITAGNLHYKVTKLTKKGGEVAVTGIKTKKTKVKIPGSIKIVVKKGKYKGTHTLKVTAIAKKAFYYDTKMKELTIGSNVRKINSKAFFKTMNLKKIKLGKNLKTISDSAFSGDYNLKSVSVPAKSELQTIGKNAFKNCILLSSFNFSNATKLTQIDKFAFAFCTNLLSVPKDKTAEYKSVKNSLNKYSFSIYPIIKDMNRFYYLKTDYPYPDKIRLVDKTCKYYTKSVEDFTHINVSTTVFSDVKYEDKSKNRVTGGYIFFSENSKIDGGNLNLELYTDVFDPSKSKNTWIDTGIIVKCPTVMAADDYLISRYTKPSMSLFEKLDAIQGAFEELSVYPMPIYDDTKGFTQGYPSISTSPYPEQGLYFRDGIGLYTSDAKALFYNANPYKFDSLDFPDEIAYYAKILDPKCKTAKNPDLHAYVFVIKDGIEKGYGGAGNQFAQHYYQSCIKTNFAFDGNKSYKSYNIDFIDIVDMNRKFGEASDKIVLPTCDAFSESKIRSQIGNGCWIRTGCATFLGGGDISFVYLSAGSDYKEKGYEPVADAWIDGRYVDKCRSFVKGVSFDEYPNANIVLTNFTYINKYGKKVTGDLTFFYDETTSKWISEVYYNNSKDYKTLPDEHVLTLNEVKNMKVDRNKDSFPAKGLVYDGTDEPGTPYSIYTD